MSEPIFCSTCGTINEEATAHFERLEEERNLAERELRGKRSLIARLKGEQAKARPPEYDDAMEVAEFWKEWCAPRAKELNGPRLAKTIERLQHGYTKEDLKLAVWGYYCLPNMKDAKRVRANEGGTRYVNLELIMRDATHVENGMDWARAERHHDQGLLNEGASRHVARLCDCGHARGDHGLYWLVKNEACYHEDCRCAQFDDIDRRSDEFLERAGYFDKQAAEASTQGSLL